MKKLKYSNLTRAFLEANDARNIKHLPMRKTDPVYSLDVDKMMSVLNAFSPYDLYQRPNSSPSKDIPYSTSALNITPLGAALRADETPKAIMFANKPSVAHPKLSPIQPMAELLTGVEHPDIPKRLHSLIAQAALAHEYNHTDDLSLRLDNAENSVGEKRAMRAEDEFWDYAMWRKKKNENGQA